MPEALRKEPSFSFTILTEFVPMGLFSVGLNIAEDVCVVCSVTRD